MSAEVGYTKRTTAELSRCFNGLSLSRNNYKNNGSTANGSAASSKSVNNEEDDELDAVTKSFQEQNLRERSGEKLNGLSNQICKEEKVLKNGASPNHQSNGRTIIPLYESELFLKIQYKANLMDSEETKDFDYNDSNDNDSNEAMITQSPTIINLFEACQLTPSKRPPPVAPPKTSKARRRNFLLSLQKPATEFELLRDVKFLHYFFRFFTSRDRCLLAQVCPTWKDVLYSDPKFWYGLTPVVYTNELRRLPVKNSPDPPDPWLIGPYIRKRIEMFRNQESIDSTSSEESVLSDTSLDERYNFHPNRVKDELYASIERRCFSSIILYAANDDDILDFVTKLSPSGLRCIQSASIRCSTITDKGLDIFLASLSQSLIQLELTSCNEISDSGLWTSLVPHLQSLTIRDCINISDETIAATSQMLTELQEMCLQTYHMSDASTSFFGPVTLRKNLKALRLENCWELTNQGVVNIVHSLPHIERLGLLGCSKITDEAIEMMSDRVRRLKVLDLSWCARITDIALQYIACDLSLNLRALNFDRCSGISDVGVGYISKLPHLIILSLRCCPQLSDSSLLSICNLKRLRLLYLAGNPLFTFKGLIHLTHLDELQLVELTNCPAVTDELVQFMRTRNPGCEVVKG
ncbi:F-box/LRR-repeat protein 16 [Tetranychus urticae]|uniref:F-box domain-containing protein n=1 Tax=Tetranychus urticae TaxID=32264 RepID=T1KCR2_TETUR|nr:F-box/LRR-repeat protein 16 [Tetranychus urticae]